MGDKHLGTLSLAILQSNLFWEDIPANLTFFQDQITQIKDNVDLVILPETFSTGFTMNVTQYADDSGKTLEWMKQMAVKNHISLTGSVIVKDDNHYFNRLYWVDKEGNNSYYDKRHLFRIGREQEYFTPGAKRLIVNIQGIRILLQICYDLRFPVFARNRGDYDAILYVANWPAARMNVWETLLVARAMENQSFVIAANRTGIDGEGVDHSGGSSVIGPKGDIKTCLNEQAGFLLSTISLKEVQSFRKKFPAYKDADDFLLK